ncbi:MAG: phospholipase D-like domain-containing protein, partial [Flavobacteriaceae bacterium]
MSLSLVLQIAYGIIIILVILRILYDTRDATKTLAYILLVVFVPLIGIFFYFSFGVNYRKRKIYSKKIIKDVKLREKIETNLKQYHDEIVEKKLVSKEHTNLINFVAEAGKNRLAANNKIDLLENGEEKFPALLEALQEAKKHIHLQYYIFADDITGNQVADVLIQKAQEGVEVRFMYDDFGSHSLGRKFIQKLEAGGVETAPFYKIIWYAFANRLNYRNHRKIVIIDGVTSFIGGINVSDRYRNDLSLNQIFWRD